MDKKILIIGHGIAGCTLAMTCLRRGIDFQILGCALPGEASFASSGLIAPITGRRYVKAWMIDELVDKALDFYRWTEDIVGKQYFFPIEIVRSLANPEYTMNWEKRLQDPEYAAYISDRRFSFPDRLDKPYGILTGGYRLDTPGWIGAVRSFLQSKSLLAILDSPYEAKEETKAIHVYSTGAVDTRFAPGIVPNKGESLIVRMPEWRIPGVIKEEIFIVPLSQEGVYWIGSYYEPLPENPMPTEEGKERLLRSIRKVYTGDLEVLGHYAGVRPTVNDRRPFVGLMPGSLNNYMFNGMGTKGTSLAPYWADQLLSLIMNGIPLPEEVSPSRYIPEPVYKSKPSS